MTEVEKLWRSERTPNVVLLRDPTSYTTATLLQRSLETQCNIKTIHAGPPQAVDLLRKLPIRVQQALLRRMWRWAISADPAFREIDLLLVVDPLRLRFSPEGLANKTAYYAIDSHVSFHDHVEQARVVDYDVVFVAQKDDLSKYRGAGCRHVQWLPLAFDPTIHRKIALKKVRNVSFVGRVWRGAETWEQERWNLLLLMQNRVGLEIHTAFLHDMVRIYNESKVVFNKSLRGDVNMRVFEALGCGCFLLTDRCGNGLGDLFKDKEHIVTYETPAEAIDLARYYLSADEDRQRIADSGYKQVHSSHTYASRTAEILRRTLGYDPSGERS